MPIKDQFWNPNPAGASLNAAYCLGVLAEVAYTQSADLLQKWAEAFDISFSRLVRTPGILTPNFMAAFHADRMIVAFPGTETWAQLGDNIMYSAQRTNPEFGSGRMHSFTLWAAEGIVDFVRPHLASFPDLREITFVGHSLGGAVAQLVADWVALNTSIAVKWCVTFNSPRVGDTDWARRARTFPTHNFYNTRDMVCEWPLSFHPSSTAWQTELGVADGYEHRDELIPITSTMTIKESWWAVEAGKTSWMGEWLLKTFGSSTPTTMAAIHRLGFVASRGVMASNVWPLPIWWYQHKMLFTLDSIEAMPRFTLTEARNSLKTIRDMIPGEPPNFENIPTTRGFLAPPGDFGPGMYPGGGYIEDLPPVPEGTRVEFIESAFQWVSTPPDIPRINLIDYNQQFIDAIFREEAAPPPVAGAPALPSPFAQIPARPDWLFRGTDRRLLEKLLELLTAIENRDWIVWEGRPSAEISNREYMIDPEDQELTDNFYALKDHVSYYLALSRG